MSAWEHVPAHEIGHWTIDDYIREVERELKLRRRSYPKWIEKEWMSQQTADRQISLMVCLLRFLKDLAGAPELPL